MCDDEQKVQKNSNLGFHKNIKLENFQHW